MQALKPVQIWFCSLHVLNIKRPSGLSVTLEIIQRWPLNIIAHCFTTVHTEFYTERTPVECISQFTDRVGNILEYILCGALLQFDAQKLTQAGAHPTCALYRQEVTKSIITKKTWKGHKLLTTRAKRCLTGCCKWFLKPLHGSAGAWTHLLIYNHKTRKNG